MNAVVVVLLTKDIAIIAIERLKEGVWRGITIKCMKLVPLMITIISLSLIVEIGEITTHMEQEMITISTDSVLTATFTAAVPMMTIATVPPLPATNLKSAPITLAQLSQDPTMRMMKLTRVPPLKSNTSHSSNNNSSLSLL